MIRLSRRVKFSKWLIFAFAAASSPCSLETSFSKVLFFSSTSLNDCRIGFSFCSKIPAIMSDTLLSLSARIRAGRGSCRRRVVGAAAWRSFRVRCEVPIPRRLWRGLDWAMGQQRRTKLSCACHLLNYAGSWPSLAACCIMDNQRITSAMNMTVDPLVICANMYHTFWRFLINC